jgi:hypothetical protein
MCRGNIMYLYAFSIVYIIYESLFKFYYKLLKSTDLTNLENAYEYFVTKSQLVVGQVSPPVLILCFKVFLCLSSILQSYMRVL